MSNLSSKLKEYIKTLEAIESKLYSPSSQSVFENASIGEQKKFRDFRLQLSNLISALITAEINNIASRLEANEAKLKQGINELSETIVELSNANMILNQISTVITTITRILGFG
jgi:ABC-type phosphate transport system auxiliary subunit